MSFIYLSCCLGSVEVDGAGMSGMLRINNLNARPLGVTDWLIQPAEINRVNNNENCHFTSLYREIKIELKKKKKERQRRRPLSLSFSPSFLPSSGFFLLFLHPQFELNLCEFRSCLRRRRRWRRRRRRRRRRESAALSIENDWRNEAAELYINLQTSNIKETERLFPPPATSREIGATFLPGMAPSFAYSSSG